MTYQTDQYQGLFAETISMPGANGELINAYYARPTGPGPYPGMVIIHHMPGWDEWYREAAHRFAFHGYATISPDLYFRVGHGTPEDVAARVRGQGGIPDDLAVGDILGALNYLRTLPNLSGKVGVFGTCSGGRHGFLAACLAPQGAGFDALIECWGGGVVADKSSLDAKHPVAPIDYTQKLSCPILGLFGNDDSHPTPEQVNIHEAELKKYGKDYEFHRYPGAGHGFFYYNRPAYRQEQAVDGWEKIFAFLERTLQG